MADMNKICRDFQVAVWDFIFNPTEIEDKALLDLYQKHIESCPQCAGTYQQVKAIAEELKQVKLPTPSEDLPNKISAKLDEFEKHKVGTDTIYLAKFKRFIRYATAASVLAVIFVLLLIFAPSQTLPEAVAEASRIHEMYIDGKINTLTSMASYNELDSYCKSTLALPEGAIPKIGGSCALMCCCDCKNACNCTPEHCEVAKFTNKGAYLVFIKDAKPISLFVVKNSVKLPDYARHSMEGMDCHVFPVNKLMVCVYAQNDVTYFWVSELGESKMHEIIAEAMK